jgi:hypothetical protein
MKNIFHRPKTRAAALKMEQHIILADCQVLAAIINFINQVGHSLTLLKTKIK